METLKPACFKHSCSRKSQPAYFLIVQFIFTLTHLYTQKCLLSAYFMQALC